MTQPRRCCGLWLCALALAGIADASAQPRIDVDVTPAWGGWSRPGRSTELDVRLNAGAATPASLDARAGREAVRVDVDLEPGRAVRLHLPVAAAETVTVTVSTRSPVAPGQRHDVAIAQAETPILGVGLATDAAVALDGFHTVAVDADQLPRSAAAYSSIDALMIDAPTLRALDERQLAALLANAADCGRIVLVDADVAPLRVLRTAAGCGGRALMSATSPSEAKALLQASLQAPMPAPISLAGLGALARPEHAAWNRWLVVLAAYFGAAALAFAYSTSLATIVLVPAIATIGVWAALQLSPSAPDVVVWAEAESGAQVARSRAWQRFVGPVRSDARLPLLPQLGTARACDPRREVRMNFDADRGLATFAEVNARLLQPVALCYAGHVPVVGAVAIDARPDGVLAVRNAGTQAWPPGRLLAGRRVHELPALAPGETASIATQLGKPATDVAVRTALSRMPAEGEAVLWKLALAGGASESIETNAWLLVSIPRR